jgi:hypothetical protein
LVGVMLQQDLGLFVLLGLFGVWRIKDSFQGKYPMLWVVWLAGSLLGIMLGGRFYGHYYQQMVPPLSVLSVLGVQWVWRMLRAEEDTTGRESWKASRLPAIVVGVLLLVLAVDVLENEWKGWRKCAKYLVSERPMEEFPIWESDDLTDLAAYFKETTEPEETVFILGYGTPAYFLSERRCASPWIYAMPDSLGYRSRANYHSAAYDKCPDCNTQLNAKHFSEIRIKKPRLVAIDETLCAVPAASAIATATRLVLPESTYHWLETEYEADRKIGPYMVFRRR